MFDKYLRSAADGNSPLIDLVPANLESLPPSTVITAEIDPLPSDKLKSAGVPVKLHSYDVTHEFFGMAAVGPQAKQAQVMGGELKAALTK